MKTNGENSGRILIDTIEVKVANPEGKELITKSDLEQPNLNGAFESKDDFIVKKLIYLDAKKFKIVGDENAVERYFRMIQQQNNLSLEQLESIIKASGRTLEQAKKEIAEMQAINQMVDFKIRSNLIVPRKLIEQYYTDNPVWINQTFKIRYASIPFDFSRNKMEEKKEIIKNIRSGNLNQFDWSEPFEVEVQDLAADKKFLKELAVKEVYGPVATSNSFELYQMLDKKEQKLVPLEERYEEISDILRKPRYEQLMEDYKKLLMDASSITIFNN